MSSLNLCPWLLTLTSFFHPSITSLHNFPSYLSATNPLYILSVPPPMWNPNHPHEEDDDTSWEVKAFAEDTANLKTITWPPKSYTCTFCRREFRSAQALGGHMNVHRRHRAQLHHRPEPISSPTNPPHGGGGICCFYQMSNPDGHACAQYPSNIPPAPAFRWMQPPAELRGTSSSSSHGSQISSKGDETFDDGHEKLDLELRLGNRPASSSSSSS